MNKKLIVFVFLFFSFVINAFQDGYQAASGLHVVQAPIDIYIANDPVGYCKLDKMPLKYCKTASIHLRGSTYKKYSLFPNVPETVNENEFDPIRENFTLGVDDVHYDAPTPGQFRMLVQEGLIPERPACYIVKKGGAHKAAGFMTSAECNSVGRVERLVTANFPAVCSDPDDKCGMIFNGVTLRFQVLNIPPSFRTATFQYFYDTIEGDRELEQISSTGVMLAPQIRSTPRGATNINVDVFADGSYQAGMTEYNLETRGHECLFVTLQNVQVSPTAVRWRLEVDPC